MLPHNFAFNIWLGLAIQKFKRLLNVWYVRKLNIGGRCIGVCYKSGRDLMSLNQPIIIIISDPPVLSHVSENQRSTLHWQ